MIRQKNKSLSDLTQGALIPQIILYTLPLIATAVLQLLFNTADTIVVGRWGGDTPEECTNALAAVGSCGSLTNLLTNLFLGLSVGAGISVAHGIGARMHDEVRKTVHTAVLTSLITGILVTIPGVLFAPTLLEWMDTDPDVLVEAARYMRAYFLGMPACMVYNYCATMLRSEGDTVRPLIFLSAAGVLNVLLNLFTVIVLRWGAMGVGVATAASQWLSAILVIAYMMRTKGLCRLELRQLRIDRRKLVQILTVGLPAGLQSTLFSFSNVLIQATVNSFGPVVVAGNTAALNLEGYIYATQNALYHTSITFVGQNEGARNYPRLKKAVLLCSLSVTLVGLTIGGLVYLLRAPLLGLYAPENLPVIAAGARRLLIFCPLYFLCGLMEVGSGALRGMGRSMTSMIIALMGSCVFRVVWIYTVVAWNPGNIMILYISYPISWFLTSAVNYILAFSIIGRKQKALRQVSEQSAEPAFTEI